MPAKVFPYKIKKKFYLARNIIGLDLIPQDGEIFGFKPGQFVMLALYDKQGKIWQQRAFSICSSPANKDYIQLGIKIQGLFTQKLDKLKKGDKVGISGPYGFFVFDEKIMKDVVFLAGGIGVTPFISAIRYANDKDLDNQLILIYSNKTRQDTAFYDELNQVAKENKNFKVIFTLTQEEPEVWKGEKGRINAEMLKKYCSPLKNKYFLFCGPAGFLKAIDTCLLDIGVSKDYIKKEGWE